MIQEDKVSYDLAVKLRNKGFNEPCMAAYNIYGVDEIEFGYADGSPLCNSESDLCLFIGDRCDDDSFVFVTAPAYGHVMKWLREVHKLHCDIDPSEGNWKPNIIELDNWSCVDDGSIPICDTYEEATEAAIKYCLENLI